MKKVVNPLTDRNMALDGRTAQRLLSQGTVVQAQGRLLRPAHAALEERATQLGLPRAVWDYPATTPEDALEPLARAIEALGEARARIQTGVAATRAPAIENPMPDADIDALLDAEEPAQEQAPPVAIDPDKYYLLYVNGALMTWNVGDGAVTLKGDQVAAQLEDLRELLEDDVVEAREVPQQAEVREDPGRGRTIVFYSYDNSRLENNRDRARTAVELLDSEARYQLFGNWGQAGERLQAVEWHVNTNPYGFRGRRKDPEQKVHDADDIDPMTIVGIDSSRWARAAQYGKAIR